jgi:ATP-dependent protease Clp ATPase subunit
MNDYIYGHAQAKKVLNTLINRSQERWYKKSVLGSEEYPTALNCFLIGPSGTGKTALVKSLANKHDMPFLTVDATSFVPSGATKDSGLNKEGLRKLIKDTAAKYISKKRSGSLEGALDKTIVFVDEFDKLGTSFDSTGNWNQHVQANFLTLIEELNNITWIFAGAFNKFFTVKETKRSIGFFNSVEEEERKITEENIIDMGIIPEILGRIHLIVQLDDFTQIDYENITKNLLETKYTELKNIDIESVARAAKNSGQGVRSITRQLELAIIDNAEPWVMPSVF